MIDSLPDSFSHPAKHISHVQFEEFTEGAIPAVSVPLRSEVPAEDTWDLSHLYKLEADYEADLEWVKKNYEALGQFSGRLGESADSLLACLEAEKELDLKVERLYHYAHLLQAEDGSDATHLARMSKLENLLTRVGEVCSYIRPELQAIPDNIFDVFLASPGLAPWVTSLRKLRRFKPHTLTQPEEKLLAMAGGALGGMDGIFSQLTNVDLDFGTITDEHGREVELTQSSYSSFLQSGDPAVRRAAFKQLYKEYGAHKQTLAAIYATGVKTDVFYARARSYPSAREASLFRDAVPVTVYDNLISSVREHLPSLFRYYKLRQKALKLTEIHQYDTYVPLIAELKVNTSFDEGINLVLESLHPLGEEYVKVLGEGLRNRWCDRYETKGKRSGAFSSSSYGNPPYILMNYKPDVFSDVYTLTHEAGHSMHSWYSQKTQSFQDYGYPIFLAEVASTFNEELLTHHLLEKTTDPKMRAYILNRQIDDIRGTVFRQTMFAEFEKNVHELEEAGEPLTLQVFKEVYRKLLEAYFGPDFSLDEELDLECLRIPHFYSAFYVYKYATGLSAAVALSQRVLNGGQAELDAYLGFLKSGGSQYPLDTLKAAGVDMTSPEPVNATMKLFGQRVEELEALLETL
jgi:oligoendopeptidase F